MRVMCLDDSTRNIYSTFEVIDVTYDEDCQGIGLYTPDEDYYYIKNVDISDVNYIANQLLVHGYCDLTPFGEVMFGE